MLSPMPRPSGLVVKNGSNDAPAIDAGIPQPVSAISISIAPAGSTRERIVTSAMRGPRDPVPSTGAETLGLRTGDDVRHDKWGDGVILLVEGAGDKAEAVIRFPAVGEKRVLLSWTPLTKL